MRDHMMGWHALPQLLADQAGDPPKPPLYTPPRVRLSEAEQAKRRALDVPRENRELQRDVDKALGREPTKPQPVATPVPEGATHCSVLNSIRAAFIARCKELAE